MRFVAPSVAVSTVLSSCAAAPIQDVDPHFLGPVVLLVAAVIVVGAVIDLSLPNRKDRFTGLLRCPHCGTRTAPTLTWKFPDGHAYACACLVGSSPDEARKKWNRRK